MLSIPARRIGAACAIGALFALLGVAAAYHTPTTNSSQAAQTLRAAVAMPPQHSRPLHLYIEIIEGCTVTLNETCVHARAAPGEDAQSVAALRTGTILKVHSVVAHEGAVWYRIALNEWLRYPKRVAPEWYVPAAQVRLFHDEGVVELADFPQATTTKRIIVDRSDNTLTAYEGDALVATYTVSIGLPETPTPRGEFRVYRKTPSRYMQGPLPGISAQHFDLPGVPWNLYFTHQGGVIHGAYWHDAFGSAWSSGCVNVAPHEAETLYRWADIGTSVIVRD